MIELKKRREEEDRQRQACEQTSSAKTLILTFRAVKGTAPDYIKTLLQPYNRLVVPSLKSARSQHKLFSCLWPLNGGITSSPSSETLTVSPPSRKGLRRTCSGSTTVLRNDWLDLMLVSSRITMTLIERLVAVVVKMIVLAVKYIVVACFFHRYTLALLRFMLFNCNLSNYMLVWFFPLGLIWFSQCMLHVLATRNVWGYLVV